MKLEIILALTTCENMADAEQLAQTLVQEKQAACISIIPSIVSYYPWQGKIERSAEVLLLIKTTAAKKDELSKRLHDIHPYSVPEFLVISPSDLSEKYGKWFAEAIN